MQSEPKNTDQDLDKVALRHEIQSAVSDASVAQLYANAFVSTIGTSDVTLLLKQNEKPVCVLNLSYTVAKTLAHKIAGLIATLEQSTGNSIMTTDDVKERLQREEAKEATQ